MDNFGLKVKATNVIGSGDGVEVFISLVMTTTSYLMRVFHLINQLLTVIAH